MFRLDMRDLQRAVRGVAGAERQMRFATAVALTRSVQDAKTAEQRVMRQVFDRTTTYALNSVAVIPATKTNLRATLHFRDFGGVPAWRYLRAEILGGPRKPKRFEKALIAAGIMRAGEFAVPAKAAQLDAYGNLSGQFFTRMLSALGASSDRTQNRNRKRKSKTARPDFFVVRNEGKAGIYQRTGRAIVPVLIFVKAPTYQPRFPYYETAAQVIPRAFNKHMRASFRRYVLPELRKG